MALARGFSAQQLGILMDFTGAKLLVAIVLVILIVFAGSVPTAHRATLDTWWGRLVAAITVLFVARQAGWWLGIMVAVAVLVLMPQSMREGFRGGGGEGGSGGRVLETAADKMYFEDYKKKDGFRGGVLETGNAQMNSNFEDYADEDERLSSIEEPFREGFSFPTGTSDLNEGFWGGADKKQKVPKERRKQWFIEEVMDEQPEVIETDTVETQAAQ
jgi:hypothetical protein